MAPNETRDAKDAKDDMGDRDDVLVIKSKRLHEQLHYLQTATSIELVRSLAHDLATQCTPPNGALLAQDTHADDTTNDTTNDLASVTLQASYFQRVMRQITQAQTLERAHYYVKRFVRSLTTAHTSSINDINLYRWQEYQHINTDSLWYEQRRDNSGVHTADYWGNFIPQIPHQMMLRYTKQYEWVLDTFAGAGTTLIEGQRLGRHTLGVELQAPVAEQARQRVQAEENRYGITWDITVGDSTTLDYPAWLAQYGQQHVQLVIMHPPYFDIIKFSDDARDLANAPSLDAFLAKMGLLVERVAPVLAPHRYLVLVISDKYVKGEWVPLGFLTMQEIVQRGFLLKSIVVKNFDGTTAKRNQQALWRYRALAGGFYLFKHEYLFLFQKR